MASKTILILGSTGMAGHMVYYFLRETTEFKVINVSYRKKLTDDSLILDVKNKSAVESVISEVKPDYIINCIGILIKGSADSENAIFVNAYFPHFLKNVADKVNAKLIHISTDCVFSGKEGNYKENSFRDADDIYGRSKALGEIDAPGHLTIRTSIIGPELKSNGEGLFNWFMTQSGSITGYTNAVWGGVTTLELAKAIVQIINHDTLSGIVHLTNGEKITKFNLLNLFKSNWNADRVSILEGAGKKTIDKSLSKSLIFDFNVPSYETMMKELYSWMVKYRSLYTLYKY
jgi:dTDP-4-dehydrorhamnose reductase